MTPRRSGLEIKVDILRLVTEPIKPTILMYKANMSWKPLHEMLGTLMSHGLVQAFPYPLFPQKSKEPAADKRSRFIYQITDEGARILKTLEANLDKLNF